MHIIALGHNHDTAPVEIRERFAFGPDKIGDALERVLEYPGVRESVILSTCNRNEIYSVVTDADAATQYITEFLHDFHEVERGMVDHSLYKFKQERAVEHLFSVASGVDSMVVGETQVAAQLKEAYAQARKASSSGPVLNRLFASSFEAGKKVRHRTRVSEGSVSVSSCAVELAQKIFTHLDDKITVLIGAGENTEQTARILKDHGAKRFIVANRTVERAAALADRLGGSGIPLEKLGEVLQHCDIVITSTSSPDPLLSEGDVRLLMQKRKNRPLFLIDLSVPRDVDPEVRGIANVFLYDVDDLSGIADENRERRATEVVRAREIIDSEVNAFMAWYRSLGVTPTIVSLRNHFESVRRSEIERMTSKLSAEEKQKVEAATRAVINKLLHPPTSEMKRASQEGDGVWLSMAVQRLFRIDQDDDE